MSQKVSEPISEFHVGTLLTLAVFGLVLSSVVMTLGVAKLAYDYQMSLPTTIQVAAVADSGASGLTSAQVAAVLNLLAAFDAPKDTITSVSAILTNTTSDDGTEPAQPPTDNNPVLTAGTMMPPRDTNSDSRVGSSTDDRPRPSMSMVCPALTRHLNRGNTGDDVTQLQQFLAQQGVLGTDNVTGTFGSSTQLALQRWQLAKGIIASTSPDSGAGEVGTLTRQAIMQKCGGVQPPGIGGGTSASSTPPMPPRPPAGSTMQPGRQ